METDTAETDTKADGEGRPVGVGACGERGAMATVGRRQRVWRGVSALDTWAINLSVLHGFITTTSIQHRDNTASNAATQISH